MNKQTAVEWLIKTIIEDKTLKNEFQWKLIFDKAKEMEKQQIMDAYEDGCCYWDSEKSSEPDVGR